jgi:hypothetical protein
MQKKKRVDFRVIYFKSSEINFSFLYALWMKIFILCFHPNVGQFFKRFMLFFKFEMLLHDLIVKICYNESLFYIITINICKILKYMIIR